MENDKIYDDRIDWMGTKKAKIDSTPYEWTSEIDQQNVFNRILCGEKFAINRQSLNFSFFKCQIRYFI